MRIFTLLRALFIAFIISSLLCPESSICHGDDVYRNSVEISSNEKFEEIISKAAHVVPLQQQFEWQQGEFICFIHFGVNTFTGREWVTGKEDPNIFNPKNWTPTSGAA